MPFVLDASVTLAWAFEDEATPATEALLDRVRDEGGIVPAVWPLEVANGLLLGERRGRLAEAQTMRFVQTLQGLPISVDDGALGEAFGAVLTLGREHGLTTYDAAYLELAARQGLPLATLDARLGAAAERMGVPLLNGG